MHQGGSRLQGLRVDRDGTANERYSRIEERAKQKLAQQAKGIDGDSGGSVATREPKQRDRKGAAWFSNARGSATKRSKATTDQALAQKDKILRQIKRQLQDLEGQHAGHMVENLEYDADAGPPFQLDLPAVLNFVGHRIVCPYKQELFRYQIKLPCTFCALVHPPDCIGSLPCSSSRRLLCSDRR